MWDIPIHQYSADCKMWDIPIHQYSAGCKRTISLFTQGSNRCVINYPISQYDNNISYDTWNTPGSNSYPRSKPVKVRNRYNIKIHLTVKVKYPITPEPNLAVNVLSTTYNVLNAFKLFKLNNLSILYVAKICKINK